MNAILERMGTGDAVLKKTKKDSADIVETDDLPNSEFCIKAPEYHIHLYRIVSVGDPDPTAR